MIFMNATDLQLQQDLRLSILNHFAWELLTRIHVSVSIAVQVKLRKE